MLRGLNGTPDRRAQIVMTADAVGGVWTYALDLATGLGRAGHSVTLVLAGPAPSADQRRQADAMAGLTLIETDAPLDWTAENDKDLARAAQIVADVAAACRADIVHFNSPTLAAYADIGVPTLGVCHSCLATWWQAVRHGAPPDDFQWRIRAAAAGYAACTLLVAPSRAFAQATADLYGVMRPAVIHNGRTPVEPADGRMPERVVLTVGRLWDDAKDLRTLDRAATDIDARLVALGPTEAPNGHRIGVDRIEAVGTLAASGVADWMARAQVFVSTARYEPFGLAVLEAAQAGLPLVLSDIPTFRELWADAAILVPPGDAGGFSAAVNGLLASPERRRSAGAAARLRASRYGLATMTNGYLDLYARLLARPVAASPHAAADKAPA